MKFLIKNMLVVFAFCSVICGQDVEELKNLHLKNNGIQTSLRELEERLNTLVEKLGVVGEKDKSEAIRLKANVIRLFPCCPLSGMDYEGFGMESGYTFRTEKTGDGYYAVSMFYEDDEFSFTTMQGNHGFITNIGKIPLENVTEKLPAFAALAKYKPPVEIENIKKEFTANGITFQQSAPARIGDTYLLRAVSYAEDGNIDSLYAVKVARQDADGSIIVFIKNLKDFPPPNPIKEGKYELSDIYETGILLKLDGIFRERDWTDVHAAFVERKLIVKGTVPKGKSAELDKILKDLGLPPDTVNEVVEK